MYQAQGYMLFPRLPNNSQLQGAGNHYLDIPMQAPSSRQRSWMQMFTYFLITNNASKFGLGLCL